MPASTSHGLPYPLPTEPVAEGAQAIRNLAEQVDLKALRAIGVVSAYCTGAFNLYTSDVALALPGIRANPQSALNASGVTFTVPVQGWYEYTVEVEGAGGNPSDLYCKLYMSPDNEANYYLQGYIFVGRYNQGGVSFNANGTMIPTHMLAGYKTRVILAFGHGAGITVDGNAAGHLARTSMTIKYLGDTPGGAAARPAPDELGPRLADDVGPQEDTPPDELWTPPVPPGDIWTPPANA